MAETGSDSLRARSRIAFSAVLTGIRVMSQSAKAQEPSMEEILASIRRIIADDETKTQAKVETPKTAGSASRPAAPPPRAAAPPPRPAQSSISAMNQDDIDTMLSGLDAPPGKANGGMMADNRAAVLDLTEAMTAPASAPEPPVFRTIEGNSDVFFAEEGAENPADEGSAAGTVEEARRMFAHNTADRPLISSATSAAVDSAFNTLANTVLVQNARTLEDLVREMMRPMLKAWLDDNLPGLVERMVRAEIERVSRGRTG
jgi:cell pole-organizing protein PopZ